MSPSIFVKNMAPLSSLDAARAIRQQLDAGTLDLSAVNQQLWPVAVVQLLLPASPASINPHHQRVTDISVGGTEELDQAARDDVTTSIAASRANGRATPESTG